MDQPSVQALMKLFEAVRDPWQSEPSFERKGERLYFTGKSAGRFIIIDRTGLMSVGEYLGDMNDAFSQIVFSAVYRHQFDSFEEADKFVLERGGQCFMRDILGLSF